MKTVIRLHVFAYNLALYLWGTKLSALSSSSLYLPLSHSAPIIREYYFDFYMLRLPGMRTGCASRKDDSQAEI